MWHTVERTLGDLTRMTGQMDREHWIVVFVAALVVGALLMRGFGSQLR